MTVADLFIKKDATVSNLANLFDYLEAAFGGVGDVRILCYARVITITIDAEVYISNGEIHEAAKELGWIIKDIVRRDMRWRTHSNRSDTAIGMS